MQGKFTAMTRHPLSRAPGVLLLRRNRPVNHALPAVHRLTPTERADTLATEGGELARDGRLAMVEAALIAADEPLTPKRLAAVASLADGAEARRLVARLQELYELDGTSFQVAEVAGGFQLQTRPDLHPWLARFRRGSMELRLSPAARETLAIVAYRQPINRADIEGIRGVQSAEVLRLLMEKGLLRIAGREDSLGRPVLYGTTKKFLQVFGLKSLKELPQAKELGPPRQKQGDDGARR
jgi:segregation and condensation protein B